MKKTFLFFIIIGILLIGQHSFCANNKSIAKDKIYIVQKGDSINKIASVHRILPWQLRQANGMGSDEFLIYPKQKLVIPTIIWKAYEGRASWYGPGFHGEKRADGQIYDQNKISIAHRTWPLGLEVRVTNLGNKKSIVAPVLDRGPYTKKNGEYDREIDLSLGAAKILGAVQPGIIPVQIAPL